jgi:translocator protein
MKIPITVRPKDAVALVLAILLSQSAGLIGAFFTVDAISAWYVTLNKPVLAPPDWIFGPVWTILYVLMGIAAFCVWRQGIQNKGVKQALAIFAIQLVLNAAWSVIFFGTHQILIALLEIVLLWGAILWTIIAFSKISRLSARLMLPYILWVSFAVYLNYAFLIKN